MRVAVLQGGRSSEHEISLRSGASVAGGLSDAGHEVVEVLISREGEWSAGGDPVILTPAEGLLGCDVAFPALHGPYGEDGTIQGTLECLDVAYVGCDVLSSALCMDKVSLKRVFAACGIPQVDFVEAGEEGWRDRALAMGMPLWVKPSRLGSSVGISRVDSEADLDQAVALATRHDPRVIIEASAAGREIECSVLGNEDPEISPPGEIVAHAEWYDFEAKYSEGGMDLRVPAPVRPETLERVRSLAATVFKVAGCSGMARCDFFVVDEEEEVLVNEINTIPGFTSTSVFSKLLEGAGYTYPQLCDRLLELALERHSAVRRHTF